MTVYVDDMYLTKMGEFKRRGGGVMKMSHMVADSTEELIAMAEKIGVHRRWIQKAGTPWEHFDVALAAREQAVRAGAVPITMRQLAMFCRERRSAPPVNPQQSAFSF